MTQNNTVEVLLKLHDAFSSAFEQAVGTLQSGTAEAQNSTDEATSANERFAESFNTLREGAQVGFEALTGNYQGLVNALSSIPGPVGAIGSAVGSFLATSVTNTEALAGQVLRLKNATGMTAEQASALIAIDKQMGISGDETALMYTRFARAIGGATDANGYFATGGRAIGTVLNNLGIQATDASGKVLPLNELLPKIADKFQQMGPSAETTALAIQLFGRQGAELLPVLLQGSSGIADMTEKAREMGTVIGDKTVDAAFRLKQSQRELDDEWEAVQTRIGPGVIGILLDINKAVLSIIDLPAKAASGFGTLGSTLQEFVHTGHLSASTGDQIKSSWMGMLTAMSNLDPELKIQLALTQALHPAVTSVATAAETAASKMQDYTQSATALTSAAAQTNQAVKNDTVTFQEYGDASQKAVDAQQADEKAIQATKDAAKEQAQATKDAAAAQAEFTKQIQSVTGAFAAQSGPLKAAQVAQDAVALATGQLSVSGFEAQRAAAALSQAYADHKITLDQVVGAVSGLATGNLSSAQAFIIAGQQGAVYYRQVKDVEQAAQQAAGQTDQLQQQTNQFRDAADRGYSSAYYLQSGIGAVGSTADTSVPKLNNVAVGMANLSSSAGIASSSANSLNTSIVNIGNNANGATGPIGNLQGAINNINTTGAIGAIVNLEGTINNLGGKSVSVGANVYGASDVQNLINLIAAVNNKTVTVTANATYNPPTTSPPACFVAGTLVDTPDGPKAIEMLHDADRVYAYDHGKLERVSRHITRTFVHPDALTLTLYLEDGRCIETTAEHMIYSPAVGTYLRAGDLGVDASLQTSNGEIIRIVRIQPGTRQTVYNIEVDELHNYYAGGVLVHNVKSSATLASARTATLHAAIGS